MAGDGKDVNISAPAAVASFAPAPPPMDRAAKLDTVIRHLIGAMKAADELREELKKDVKPRALAE